MNDDAQSMTYIVRLTYWGSTTTHITTTDCAEARRVHRTLLMSLASCSRAGQPHLEWVESADA
jgi:hypothetical protein